MVASFTLKAPPTLPPIALSWGTPRRLMSSKQPYTWAPVFCCQRLGVTHVVEVPVGDEDGVHLLRPLHVLGRLGAGQPGVDDNRGPARGTEDEGRVAPPGELRLSGRGGGLLFGGPLTGGLCTRRARQRQERSHHQSCEPGLHCVLLLEKTGVPRCHRGPPRSRGRLFGERTIVQRQIRPYTARWTDGGGEAYGSRRIR